MVEVWFFVFDGKVEIFKSIINMVKDRVLIGIII